MKISKNKNSGDEGGDATRRENKRDQVVVNSPKINSFHDFLVEHARVPGPCDQHGALTCREWLLSLDNPSKINSVAPCTETIKDSVCYVVSFDSVDVTIIGERSRDDVERITPAAVTSIRIDNVVTIME